MVNPAEREGSTHPLDERIWKRVEEQCSKNLKKDDFLIRDLLESFPIYARRINLARFLARYELFRVVKDLPGCVLECGVYRGAGLLTWAKLAEIFCTGDRTKKIIGFDNFKGFESLHPKDGPEMSKRSKVVGGWNPSEFYDELLEHIETFEMDSYVPRAPRIELVEGSIEKTAPDFISKNSGIRISILNIDMDIYEPTLAALENFYDLVVPGGIIILDEYGIEAWGGEAKAFDDFFAGKNKPELKKLPFYSLPGAYFVKE